MVSDARAIQRRRRRRIALAFAAVAGLATAGTLALEAGSGARRGDSRARAAALLRESSLSGPATVTPQLEGGGYGWCVKFAQGGSCATLPTRRAPIASGIALSEGAARQTHVLMLLGAEVHAIVAQGRPLPVTMLHGLLPPGVRLVRVDVGRTNLSWPFGLTALDARGRPIAEPSGEARARQAHVRWWQAPERAPSGPCTLRARGVPGLTPEWGHVARTVAPYDSPIVGRAFFSCIDSEYYLHRWPLLGAVLLDAQRPGRTPAPLPGEHPIPGDPGIVEAPGDFHGEIAAERRGATWLVVAGGSGTAQRVMVLRHLAARVRL